MKIDSLTIGEFRNLERLTLDPHPALNLIWGANAQGKTSILEAICVLSRLRSFREFQNYRLIRFGAEHAELRAGLFRESKASGRLTETILRATPRFERTELCVILSLRKEPEESPLIRERLSVSKRVAINGKSVARASEYLAKKFADYPLGFHVLTFSPNEIQLILGDPALRRAYLDQSLCALDLDYLAVLRRYNLTLAQRNAALKTDRYSRILVQTLTNSLCGLGAELIWGRRRWISAMSDQLNEALKRFAPKQAPLQLRYLSHYPSPSDDALEAGQRPLQETADTVRKLVDELLEHAQKVESQERSARHTLVGPHRDDWSFCSGDRPLKGYASQGEMKSALLALKFAEIAYCQSQTTQMPILLLDDFSSELDPQRRNDLFELVRMRGLQAFITSANSDLAHQAHYEYGGDSYAHYTLDNGQLRGGGQI